MVARAHPIASERGGVRDQWCTPQWVVDLILRVWPFIGCDPCSNVHAIVPAIHRYGLELSTGLFGDGMQVIWPPCTYVNPPYSDPAPWVERCAQTPCCMAMLRCDPSVAWWRDVWSASAIAFFRKRVQFVPPPGVRASQNTGANVLALFNAPLSMQLAFCDVLGEVAHVVKGDPS